MKAFFDYDGTLVVEAENTTEAIALLHWMDEFKKNELCLELDYKMPAEDHFGLEKRKELLFRKP